MENLKKTVIDCTGERIDLDNIKLKNCPYCGMFLDVELKGVQ